MQGRRDSLVFSLGVRVEGRLTAMPAVSPVQEVEQRAEQHQEVGQDAKKMGGVLGDQEKSSDGEEGEQHEPAPSPQPVVRVRLWGGTHGLDLAPSMRSSQSA